MKRALIILLVLARAAGADTEWVLVLDNSGSMAQGSTDRMTGQTLPPNDPDRLAVIATLVFRALMGPEDRLTILTFDESRPGIYKEIANDATAIRSLSFGGSTFVVGPLKRAREILDASRALRKFLVFATDGAPSPETPGGNPISPAEARALLGVDPGPPKFEVVSIALSRLPKEWITSMELFLRPLGRYEFVDNPAKLAGVFTQVYADSIRSRPETGRLEPGATFAFTAGKYVSNVYVGIVTEQQTGPFTATLTADGQPIAAIDRGDSGCATPPCHAYQVFRTPHDPNVESKVAIALPADARGPVAYGTVLEYDLQADLVFAPAKLRVGETLDVVARMTWKGKTFDDPAFFAADGFTATLALGDTEVAMTARRDGTFVGKLVVPGDSRRDRVAVRFKNQWLSIADGREIAIDAWAPLDLKIARVDFGSWTGERTESERCIEVDLAGSTNADAVPLEAFADRLGDGYRLEVAKPLVVKAGKFRACLIAPGCCSASPVDATLTVRGIDSHYHATAATVPLEAHVAATSFVTCWWPYIAAGIGAIVFVIVVAGFVRPRDFASEDVIRLAKSEPALSRATGRRLRDLPGGKRGFYRNARVAFDGGGNAVRAASGAAVILRAAKGDPQVTIHGGLEAKDPRTRKFQPIDVTNGPVLLRRGVVYKSGEFVFRLG